MAVLQLLEREELQKLQKKWWYDKGECVVESDKVTLRTKMSLSFLLFTARRYASAVYAMAVCLSVCVCPSQVGVLLKCVIAHGL